MNQAIRDRWAGVLRSGPYQQCHHRLRKGNTFCCLGVLCDLLDPNGWKFESPFGWTHRGSEQLVPVALAEQAGLPVVWQEYLSELNDAKEWNFGRIATEIERIPCI